MADLIRQLLEARRALASELDSDLADRGFPDVRPGHAAVFLGVDRRSGSRLTDLAEHVRLTARGRRAAAECRRAVQSVEQRTRRQLGDRRYDTLRETLEELAESELEAEA